MDKIEQVDLSNENEEENDIRLTSKKKRNVSMITKLEIVHAAHNSSISEAARSYGVARQV